MGVARNAHTMTISQKAAPIWDSLFLLIFIFSPPFLTNYFYE